MSYRCRANRAHIRQSRPDYGPEFQVKVVKAMKSFPIRSEAEPATLRGGPLDLREELSGRSLEVAHKVIRENFKRNVSRLKCFAVHNRIVALGKSSNFLVVWRVPRVRFKWTRKWCSKMMSRMMT